MLSSRMLRRVALGITDVSGELSASIIRVTRIGELGTTLLNVAKTEIKSRGCSASLTTQHPSMYKSWN
jgi:hypothetical protein